jgi:hypothetical protein
MTEVPTQVPDAPISAVPEEPTVPKLEIKTFSARHVKNLAMLLANVADDQQVQNALSFAVKGDPEDVKASIVPLVGTLVGVGLQQIADELDAFFASLLEMDVEDFLDHDADIYPETAKALIEHPKFHSFLKSAKGMAGVIGTRWSTFSPNATDGPSSTSNVSTLNGSTDITSS